MIFMFTTKNAHLKYGMLFCHCRVVIEKDTKVPCAAIFTVNKEDHTLGNLLRTYVLLNAVTKPSL